MKLIITGSLTDFQEVLYKNGGTFDDEDYSDFIYKTGKLIKVKIIVSGLEREDKKDIKFDLNGVNLNRLERQMLKHTGNILKQMAIDFW